MNKTLALGVAAVISATFGVSGVHAQKFPRKPVKMVVPFGAGGATHTLARLFAEEMTKTLGKKVVVTAVPGSGGAVGSAQVARAKPDGYTILMGSNGTIGMRWQTSETGFDMSNFIPLGSIASLPTGWAVKADSKIKTMKDLAEYVKKNPGVKYASVGTGSSLHLATETWADSFGGKIIHVAGRGGKQAIVKLLSGEVEFVAIAASNFPAQRSKAKAKGGPGQFRGIGVTAPYEFASDIPTMKSMGYNVGEVTWWGPFAVKGTPQPVVDILAKAVQGAATSASFKKTLKKFNYVASYKNPKDTAADLTGYAKVMEKALRKAGMHKSQGKKK
ncbi:MAG: tripartite tricarboxylate transporter substrate binding protein [Hyphomicrobiales bacterium]|nr:tripartite tricarboxylate transporter substrate binding protein [Hyphomicrobiales bacterium]